MDDAGRVVDATCEVVCVCVCVCAMMRVVLWMRLVCALVIHLCTCELVLCIMHVATEDHGGC